MNLLVRVAHKLDCIQIISMAIMPLMVKWRGRLRRGRWRTGNYSLIWNGLTVLNQMLIQMGCKQKIHSSSHGEEVCVVTVCHRNSTSKLPGILEDTNCSGYSTSQHTRHSAFWVLFSTLSPCSRSTTCARPAWPLEQPAVRQPLTFLILAGRRAWAGHQKSGDKLRMRI